MVQFGVALDFQLFPSCDKRKLVTKIPRHNRKIYLLCFIRNFRRSEELIQLTTNFVWCTRYSRSRQRVGVGRNLSGVEVSRPCSRRLQLHIGRLQWPAISVLSINSLRNRLRAFLPATPVKLHGRRIISRTTRGRDKFRY